MAEKYVSIVAPIYNEAKFIEDFINSILEQDYPKDSLEVFLVDGMSNDGTRDVIEKYVTEYSFLHLLDNPKQVVPYALNAGIKASNGEVIIRLDAHCRYPKNYISTLVYELYHLNADNVGGFWHTLPAKDNNVCHAIAICSSHWFGVGNSAHKIGINLYKQVDTVPFGCYRREVFDKIGYFDEELVRNQDDEFNARLIQSGGTIYLVPLQIDYTARNSISKMCKMYYQYGLYKPLVNKKLGHPATIRQFFPAAFVAGLIAGLLFTAAYFSTGYMFFNVVTSVFAMVMLFYFALGISIGIKHSKLQKRPLLTIIVPLTFLHIHVSYGIGYLKGMWNVVFGKMAKVEANR